MFDEVVPGMRYRRRCLVDNILPETRVPWLAVGSKPRARGSLPLREGWTYGAMRVCFATANGHTFVIMADEIPNE